MAKRMPGYEVRNDGLGPYAIFYCDECSRQFRSLPDAGCTIAEDIGRQTTGGFLRDAPLVGSAAADSMLEDPRNSFQLTRKQLQAAWAQLADRFRECPACDSVVCLSCFDAQSGCCNDCTPRKGETAPS